MTKHGDITAADEATLTSDGQLKVPESIRQQLGIKPGDRLQFEVTGPGESRMRVRRKENVFDLLNRLPRIKEIGNIDRTAINEAADAALSKKFGKPPR